MDIVLLVVIYREINLHSGFKHLGINQVEVVYNIVMAFHLVFIHIYSLESLLFLGFFLFPAHPLAIFLIQLEVFFGHKDRCYVVTHQCFKIFTRKSIICPAIEHKTVFLLEIEGKLRDGIYNYTFQGNWKVIHFHLLPNSCSRGIFENRPLH